MADLLRRFRGVGIALATPAGFKNHGAFVSCVAHMDVTLVTIDWTTSDGRETCNTSSPKAANGTEKAAAAKVKADAGKAKGAAARAAHGKPTQHGGPNR